MQPMNCWEVVGRVMQTDPIANVLLWGPCGTGKSYCGRTQGLRPGRPVLTINLTEDTAAAELRGHYGLVEGSYKWLDGPCLTAWRGGHRLVLNELEKSSGDAHSFLLGILDDLQVASMTLPTGETVQPSPGFHVIATSNAPPEDLEPALRDRFPIAIHIDTVHQRALELLPNHLRAAAQNSALVDDPMRRVSIRSWNAFARLLQVSGGDEALAARAVFGKRADDMLGALKVART